VSRRYEYAGPDTPAEIVPPDAGEDSGLELDDGHHALVIGDPWASAYAIEGTPEGIRAFAGRIADLVEAGLPRAITPAGDEQLAAWLEAACPDGPACLNHDDCQTLGPEFWCQTGCCIELETE